MDDEKTNKYTTFNGLGRPALAWGVPVMVLISFIFAVIFTLFLGFIIGWGVFSFIIPFILLSILFFLKIKCETNDKAIDIMKLDLMGLFLMIKSGGGIISLTANQYSKKEKEKNVKEFIKKHY